MTKARADDGKSDDDLETFLATVDSSTGCMRFASETKGVIDHLASSAADFVKNLFVGNFGLRCDIEPSIMAVAEKVKANMPDTVVVWRVHCDTAQRATVSRNGQFGHLANN